MIYILNTAKKKKKKKKKCFAIKNTLKSLKP